MCVLDTCKKVRSISILGYLCLAFALSKTRQTRMNDLLWSSLQYVTTPDMNIKNQQDMLRIVYSCLNTWLVCLRGRWLCSAVPVKIGYDTHALITSRRRFADQLATDSLRIKGSDLGRLLPTYIRLLQSSVIFHHSASTHQTPFVRHAGFIGFLTDNRDKFLLVQPCVLIAHSQTYSESEQLEIQISLYKSLSGEAQTCAQ